MDKKVRNILYIILGIFILCIIFLIIRGVLLYYNIKNAFMYTFSNSEFSNECNGQKVCRVVSNAHIHEVKKYPTNINIKNFDINIAKYNMYLIYNLAINAYNNKPPETIQGLNLVTNLYDNKSDPIFGYLHKDLLNNIFWLSFRGTITKTEGKQDIDFKQQDTLSSKDKIQKTLTFSNYEDNNQNIQVHEGFLEAYTNVKETLYNSLSTNITKGASIIVSGHSLGAAVATIAGIDLFKNGYKNVVVYNFASPKVGNPDFAELVDQSIPVYRFINTEDIIPTLPPSVSPNFSDNKNPYIFQHCGKVIPVTFNRLSIINNHLIPGYMQSIININKQNKCVDLLHRFS